MTKISKINKKLIKLIIIIIIFIIILLIILSIIFKNNKKQELINIGKDFYENVYYETISNLSNKEVLLSPYKDKGLEITLNTLKTTSNIDKLNTCNKDTTKVIIYPKSPYNKEDYTIKVVLDC